MLNHYKAQHPIDAICPTHGSDTMNIYQGGQHRNYACQVAACDFQTYRHPCPDCATYFGLLNRETDRVESCPKCAFAEKREKARDLIVHAALAWHGNMEHGRDMTDEAYSVAREEDQDVLADVVMEFTDLAGTMPDPQRHYGDLRVQVLDDA